VNSVTSASLRYPLSVFNKNSTLKESKHERPPVPEKKGKKDEQASYIKIMLPTVDVGKKGKKLSNPPHPTQEKNK